MERKNKDPFDYESIKEPSTDEKFERDYESFNKYCCKLSKLEYERYKKFQENHRHKDINKGAIGGHISMTFTFTSIGEAKTCHCGVCGQEANITDYNW